MSAFLGIGFGPIQTGIFLAGAFDGGVDRVAVAEVDSALVAAVRRAGGAIAINVAGKAGIETKLIEGVEIYNPNDPADFPKLLEMATIADEVATALPGVKFFKDVAPWLRQGFSSDPGRRRFIYVAENGNRAAELLAEALGLSLPKTHCLNTVVGKMSGIVPAEECEARGLAPLCEGAGKGHLVEEFKDILISAAPGIEARKVANLHPKACLLPFEEAKLYGHNAMHLLLALLAKRRGLKRMHELSFFRDETSFVRDAFIEEAGLALCRKWEGIDELFTPSGFIAHVDGLLERILNPFLADRVERVCRDLERKLAWDDRLIGAVRLCLSQGVEPLRISKLAAMAASAFFMESGFRSLWQAPWDLEKGRILAALNGVDGKASR